MRLSILEWGLVAVVAVLLPLAVVQSWRASSLSDDVELYEAAVQGYAGAQATNLATIATQADRLEDWRRACSPGDAQAAVLARLRADLAQARSDLLASKNHREVIYVQDPAARRWADAGMPAAVADQLFPDPDRPD